MKHEQILNGTICPYCTQDSEFVDSEVIYGYGRSYGMIYLCRDCDAYVGVHDGTDKSKGSLANYELRRARNKAHKAFDKLWINAENRRLARFNAYQKLSMAMKIETDKCHIGMFDINKCEQVIELTKGEM